MERAHEVVRQQLSQDLRAAADRQQDLQRRYDNTVARLHLFENDNERLKDELATCMQLLAATREGMAMAADDALATCLRDFDKVKQWHVRPHSYGLCERFSLGWSRCSCSCSCLCLPLLLSSLWDGVLCA